MAGIFGWEILRYEKQDGRVKRPLQEGFLMERIRWLKKTGGVTFHFV
jgi:hypothetical protein